MSESVGFFESFFIWRDAVLALGLAAIGLGFLGVWVVLKKVVYVPLVLSQVSSVGVVTAYLLGSLLGGDPVEEGCLHLLDPTGAALLFSLLAAFWFARPKHDSDLAMVFAYLFAAAAVLILGTWVRQDLHDVQAILFGNAVLIELSQVWAVAGALVLVLGLHAVCYRRFLFASFDPDAAGASGLPVFRLEVLLYASLALMISMATKTIGALPTFGLTVLPAMAALRLSKSMRAAFAWAVAIGVGSAGLGYCLSFVYGLPTGATVVALAGVGYLGTLLRKT